MAREKKGEWILQKIFFEIFNSSAVISGCDHLLQICRFCNLWGNNLDNGTRASVSSRKQGSEISGKGIMHVCVKMNVSLSFTWVGTVNPRKRARPVHCN